MKRLYTSHDGMMVGFLKAMLENSGIDCIIRNEHLSGAAGELPVNECWQQIWLTDEADFSRAERLLKEALHEPTDLRSWSCPACKEEIEAQFGQCWNCGAQCA
jgi:hypothetical protein